MTAGVKLEAKALRDPFVQRLHEIQEAFQLSDDDTDVFVFVYAKESEVHDEDLFHSTETGLFDGLRRASDWVNLATTCLNMSRRSGRQVFSESGQLFRCGLIDSDFDIKEGIEQYLSGFSKEPLMSIFFHKNTVKPIPLSDHSLRARDSEIIQHIIRGATRGEGVNILLYGVPGTGKTEYCRSLAWDLQRELFELKCKSEGDRRVTDRYTAYHACKNRVVVGESIILIDEADEMLNGDSGGGFASLFRKPSRNNEKNKINEILDTSTTVNIWITNHFDAIEESTRRRFDYSIEFKRFGVEQRRDVWNVLVKKYRLLGKINATHRDELARTYELNAGGIDVTLKNLKRMPKSMHGLSTLKELIASHLKLMDLGETSTMLAPVKKYTLNGLHIKGVLGIDKGLKMLNQFSSFMRTPAYATSDIQNMNVLLHGAPGTGKTEFVKYLARATKRELLLKRGSDFLSPYVGQTEHNIGDVFREAEEQNAVLFIDEADGLLYDRSQASQSWQMTQVNELLIQIEHFKGILVCSTNHMANMDPATFRRFNLKFEFDYLENSGKQIFYDTILAPICGASLDHKGQVALCGISHLTPGDFKVVQQKFSFSECQPTSEMLIEALVEEVSYKHIEAPLNIGFQV